MKRTLTITAAALAMTVNAFAQSTWTVDNSHSKVKFAVSHLVISEVEGSFNVYEGTLLASKDFSDAKVEFGVDVKSINTDNESRDQHLKSDDFFAAEKFPKATFQSTSWKKVGDQNFVLEGSLTIRDVTKPVVFSVVNGGTVKDPWGNIKTGFKATATINRFDYNLKWNAITEAGGAVVGKDVTLTLNLEFAQKKSS
jgi:polyisoprenoid-binding protein YceI